MPKPENKKLLYGKSPYKSLARQICYGLIYCAPRWKSAACGILSLFGFFNGRLCGRYYNRGVFAVAGIVGEVMDVADFSGVYIARVVPDCACECDYFRVGPSERIAENLVSLSHSAL